MRFWVVTLSCCFAIALVPEFWTIMGCIAALGIVGTIEIWRK